MRTTDDLQEQKPWQPLGKAEPKPAPKLAPEWKQVEGAAKGVGIGSDGKLSTRIPGAW